MWDINLIYIATFVITVSWILLYGFLLMRERRRGEEKVLTALIVLGSGGHTAEMMRLVSVLDRRRGFARKVYVTADGDELSRQKVSEEADDGDVQIITVPRAREVMQSWFSTVFTTAHAFVSCCRLLADTRPDLVLCNGPGTCVPVCLAAWLRNKSGLRRGRGAKIVFVESICRVTTLSMSGRILMYLADDVLVQWPELAQKYPGTKYLGRFT